MRVSKPPRRTHSKVYNRVGHVDRLADPSERRLGDHLTHARVFRGREVPRERWAVSARTGLTERSQAHSPVLVDPGAMALTRIPFPPYSAAAVLVRLANAALEEPYAAQ